MTERDITIEVVSGETAHIWSGGAGGTGATLGDGHTGGGPGLDAPVLGGSAGDAIVSNGNSVTKIETGTFDIRGDET